MTRNASSLAAPERHGARRLCHVVAAHKHAMDMVGLQNVLATHPDLKGVRVEKNAPVVGGFAPETDTLALRGQDPDIMAHEMAHAVNLRNSVMYRKLLGLTSALSRINQRVSAPVAELIRNLVSDRRKRDDYLNTMSGISAMLSAPRLVEEINASDAALRWRAHDPDAEDKMRYALGEYVRQALKPIATYQAARDHFTNPAQ